MWNLENIRLTLQKTDKDIVDDTISTMGQADLIEQMITTDLEPKIIALESNVNAHKATLLALPSIGEEDAQDVLGLTLDPGQISLLDGYATKAEKVEYLLSLYAIKGINQMMQSLFWVDKWDVNDGDSTYKVVYSPVWDPTVWSWSPAIAVASRATYHPDGAPSGQRWDFLTTLTNRIWSEIDGLPIAIEWVLVDDQVRQELDELKTAVNIEQIDPELSAIIQYYNEITVDTISQTIAYDRLPEKIQELRLWIQKIDDQLDAV